MNTALEITAGPRGFERTRIVQELSNIVQPDAALTRKCQQHLVAGSERGTTQTPLLTTSEHLARVVWVEGLYNLVKKCHKDLWTQFADVALIRDEKPRLTDYEVVVRVTGDSDDPSNLYRYRLGDMELTEAEVILWVHEYDNRLQRVKAIIDQHPNLATANLVDQVFVESEQKPVDYRSMQPNMQIKLKRSNPFYVVVPSPLLQPSSHHQ